MASEFKKGDKIVYPKHGAGKILKIYNVFINGEKKRYYKLYFLKSPTTVSVPVKTAQSLGLRSPLSRDKLKKVLKNFNSIVAINKKTLITLDSVSKAKLNSGKLEDVIDLVNLLKSLAKQKEEENKNFSYSYSDRLEIAMEFIESEIETVLGKAGFKKYGFKEA